MRDNPHLIEQEEVMAYLDGELSVDEAARAAAHLEECSECQKLASELRSLSQDLMTWQIESVDPQPTPAIATALDERQQKPEAYPPLIPVITPSGPSWLRRWNAFSLSMAGVGMALLLIVGLLFTMNRPTMRERAVSTPGSRDLESRAMSQMTLQVHKEDGPPPPAAAPRANGVVGGVPGGVIGGELGSVRLNSVTASSPTENSPPANGPMIVRTAQLALIAKDFDKARAGMDAILQRHGGYVGNLSVSSPTGAERRLTATLRVPSDQLQATLDELKTLGRVDSESQTGEEVSAQYVDLEARLNNARNTEKRLTDLLRQQTGKLADVLAVEEEISRVRGEIESMEAERKLLAKKVAYATLNATIAEDYKAQLQVVPPSLATQFRNAAVDGYQSVTDGIVTFLLFLMSWGPSLLLWAAILFFPLRYLWRRMRRPAEGK